VEDAGLEDSTEDTGLHELTKGRYEERLLPYAAALSDTRREIIVESYDDPYISVFTDNFTALKPFQGRVWQSRVDNTTCRRR
jgi:hypothetical protein